MDKEIKTTKTVEVETITHKFYCDECGVFLGETEECDDGYYDEIGKYEWEFRIGDWLRKKGNYCPDCGPKVRERIVSTLEGLGFEKRKY